MNITETAKLIGVSRARLHQIIKELGIQPQKISAPLGGRGYYYLLSAEQVKAIQKTTRKKSGARGKKSNYNT